MTDAAGVELRPDLTVHTHGKKTAHEHKTSELDTLCVNTIRTLAMDAVQAANNGHPGTPMGLAPLAYAIWTQHMKYNPRDPAWPNRDRFILSCGHASMLLYALLHLTGFDLPLDELKRFRQWESKTPGHPEYGETAGVEVSTGPLGQGISNAIGMAIAERMMAERFNRPEYDIVDNYTWVIASDGDLMEGVAAEAASLAGNMHLGKLIVFYDDNHITIEGSTDLAFSESVPDRFRSYGWRVFEIEDGNDLHDIEHAVAAAKTGPEHPNLVVTRTHIGFGSPNKQDTAAAHGAPLGDDEILATKQNLGWPHTEPFTVPDEARAVFGQAVARGAAAQAEWKKMFEAYTREFPDLAAEYLRVLSGRLPDGWADSLPSFPESESHATRSASGVTINAIAAALPELIGGSADLAPSTDTYMKGYADVSCDDFSGRNFHFGVREHGMGSVTNGLAVYGGFRPFCATFFVFSDYMRPAIRMAAIMGIPVTFVFTHDSIGLGEDGPTHQPIEHLAGLRAMPNLVVIRPADANETAQAWRVALERKTGPTVLVLTRQKLPVLPAGGNVAAGAYVLAEGTDVVLIGTGSEVAPALAARDLLAAEGISAGVVSMPSWELFRAQPKEYRERTLPSGTPKLAIEAAASFGWAEWSDASVSLDRFGASAPGEILMKEFGFSPENIAARARELLR